MPSLKRDSLLSDLERERLMKRDTLDRHTRSTNDVRVKRKLTAWMKNISDVRKILSNLPEDQIKDATHDSDIYFLFDIIENLLLKRRFYPLEGDIRYPEDWQIVIDEDTERPAENLDIIRSSLLRHRILKLMSFYDMNDPVGLVETIERMSKDPNIQNRVTDEDRKAIKRLNQAKEWFSIETGWPFKKTSDAPE
jgi:hypothetical protein